MDRSLIQQELASLREDVKSFAKEDTSYDSPLLLMIVCVIVSSLLVLLLLQLSSPGRMFILGFLLGVGIVVALWLRNR